MSRKRKDKLLSKRKHGQVLREIDFFTPLSSRECMARLEARRPPFEGLAVGVSTGEGKFRLDLYSLNTPVNAWWPTSVWAEGHLEERGDGVTHVKGRILLESFLFDYLRGMVMSLLSILLLVLLMLKGYGGIFVAGGVGLALLFGVGYPLTSLGWNRMQARGLARWIEGRLDVERREERGANGPN